MKRVCNGSGEDLLKGYRPTRAGWLVPYNYSSYVCAEGVEVGALGLLNTYRQVTKASYTVTVPSMSLRNQNYDDVYAIYTGALGAVFGAFAASCGVAVVMLFVVILRCGMKAASNGC
jgi:hypothetical protein